MANGFEIVVLPDPSVPIVTVEIAVRAGSFVEPPELHGLSHLFEHMIFKPNFATLIKECTPAGTQGQPMRAECATALRYRSKIGDISYLQNSDKLSFRNGSTREEIVNYFYTVQKQYLDAAMRQLNDSIRYPAFLESAFDEEKKNVIAEIDRLETNPFGLLDRTMKQRLFSKYPTRKDPQGTRESITAATIEKMKTIQSRYYVPNNAALIVTGDVDPTEVFAKAESIFGSWEKRAVDPFKEFPLVEHPPLVKSEGIVLERPASDLSDPTASQNVVVFLGWQGPSIGKDDASTYAADVFSYIIDQPGSRFQRNLVDSGLAQSVGFGYYTQRNVGPINLSLTTTPQDAKKALVAVYKELADFTRPDYFTDEELNAAKTILENRDLFEREKLTEYAHTLGFWWSSTGLDYFRGYHTKLRSTSREDINRYLKAYVIGKHHVGIALVTPETKAAAALTERDLIGGAR